MNACLHCGRGCGARRKRGLCRRCHALPQVRARYPHSGTTLLGLGAASPRGRDFQGPAPPPDDPDPGLTPGPEKLPLLARRAARGVSLFPPPDPAGRPRERTLDLRLLALPYGARYPLLWLVLARLCPELRKLLSP